MRALLAITTAALLTLVGCGDDEETAPLEIAAGCNPLASARDCLLPYPSDVHLVDDASMPSGRRLAPAAVAWPQSSNGGFDMWSLHPADGFPIGSQMLALLDEPIAADGLVGPADDLEASLEPASPTQLIDAVSGERLLHLAELDARAEDPMRRALIIRPLVRLEDGRRYIVALRGVRGLDGAPLPAPRGFAALRDGRPDEHPALATIAARYESDVFAPLESAGLPRGELQLAWDFTTRTRGNAISDMLSVRQQLLERVASGPPTINIISVSDAPDAHTFRRIEATVAVPHFMEADEPLARLLRDDSGLPTHKGNIDVPFTLWIPNSVANRAATDPPARLMQYGHGFFGGRDEVDDLVAEIADQRGFVVVACDWLGMSAPDRIPIANRMTGDTATTMVFTDRVHQGMANQMAVLEATRTSLLGLSELAVGPTPLFDANTPYFYGNSQGAIMGGTYLAQSPHIERGVLGVGGANFALIMFRSRAMGVFLVFLEQVVEDPLEQQKFGVAAQSSFDRVDPISYATEVLSPSLPNTPAARRILMQVGRDDVAVPELSAHLHARAMGLSHLQPAPRSIAAFPQVLGPHDGSALVEFDFGVQPPVGLVPIPPSADNAAHEGVRRLESSIEQLDRFLSPGGAIEHTCNAACDPE
jgi:hypothetical protein